MKTRFLVKTKNPPLVFLHGFRGNGSGLIEFKPFFPNHQVFIPSIPPAGKQDLEKYDLDHYLSWIKNYLKENHIEKPILIGHSMGSILAAAFAHRYPELINQKLILMGPISKKSPRIFIPLQPLMLIAPRLTVDYIFTRYLFVPKDKTLFRHALDLTNQCTDDFPSKISLLKSAFFANRYSIADFPNTKQTLLIAGEKDRLIPKSVTQKLAKNYHWDLEIVKNTGHILNYEDPEGVSKIISDFIS